ncbi:PfkB family carbohydrate kinase [Microbacterium sp.]|uniref:PfkB family carbohydrate kinase n=1 Tax=Microbacterium sp. TaxID=51671 RepID=UPI0035617F16
MSQNGDGTDVLVIGEALVDIVEKNDIVSEHPGGSAANVALGLGRLGVSVEILTHIAEDRRGQAIAEHLEASEVRVRPESFGARRTSTAVARLNEDGAATYEFDVSWALPPLSGPPAVRVLHVGSFAVFLSDLDHLLEMVKRSSALEVSIDPNVRPAIAGSHLEALRRFETVASVSSLVKLSDADAKRLYPGQDPEGVLNRMLELGARLAVVTAASGVLLATPTRRIRVAAPRVRTVDTIGAGDTVTASLLDAVLHGGVPTSEPDLQALGDSAVRAAATTVSRAGADLPWADELRR